MTWAVFQTVWPILAVLVYLLVTCVLTVLAYARKNEVELHCRVYDSLRMRQAYTEAIREQTQATDIDIQ